MILRSQFAGGVWKQWIIMSSEIAASICVRYYENFEIDDTTGKPLTRREVTDLHYDRLQLLQRVPGRHLNGPLGAAHRVDIIWRLSENSVPLNPMVLLIIIPIKWLLYNWEYTQHFQTPIWRLSGRMVSLRLSKVCFQEFPENPSLKQIMLINVANLDTRTDSSCESWKRHGGFCVVLSESRKRCEGY